MKRRIPSSVTAVLLPAVVIVAGPAATWLIIHDRGWKTPWVLVSIGAALTLSVALAGLVEREVARRRTESDVAPAPDGLTAEQREQWRAWLRAQITRTRVGEVGQLAKMIRQGDPIDQNTRRVDQDEGRPRVRVGGQLLPWSEITKRWDAGEASLVLLGDPGYGKTVAALTLIKHINACSEPGASVAELFALSEWQRWRGEHPAAPLGEWLAAQLTLVHSQLEGAVARELVDAHLVLPVLDGLDEIANVEDRRACVAAIDAYAERGVPHRPFVLTCRAREYYELAPDWVRDDERVVLVGLQPDQIRDKLAEPQITGRPGWNALRERQAAGDIAINELFRSPLRLAIALQVYRDPSELLMLSVGQARERLWELLLASNADSYRDATAAQVRAWLAWLASGTRYTGRQRFALHELYLLDPHSPKTFRAFRIVVGLVFGLAYGLVAGLGVGLVAGLAFGLAFGLVSGLAYGLFAGQGSSAQPSVRTQRGWRERLKHATGAEVLAGRLVVALVVALVFGLVAGLGVGLVVGLAFGLVGLLSALLAPEVIAADPPRRFARARPDAVLTASRSNGLVAGLVVGLAVGLVVVVVGLVVVASGLLVGLASGLASGLLAGLLAGLDAWLYHHWLRWRRATHGVLPARLPAFLEWCAQDERGWLRISDAYEFRHRELLEHLAPAAPRPTDPTGRDVREG